MYHLELTLKLYELKYIEFILIVFFPSYSVMYNLSPHTIRVDYVSLFHYSELFCLWPQKSNLVPRHIILKGDFKEPEQSLWGASKFLSGAAVPVGMLGHE
jgi:hypothetical protein